MSPKEEQLANFDELMAMVNRLGNHQLVAQTRYSLEADGITPTTDFCKNCFVACAHMCELAERARDSGSFNTIEMVAAQEVASLGMQIWATLHDQIATGIIE